MPDLIEGPPIEPMKGDDSTPPDPSNNPHIIQGPPGEPRMRGNLPALRPGTRPAGRGRLRAHIMRNRRARIDAIKKRLMDWKAVPLPERPDVETVRRLERFATRIGERNISLDLKNRSEIMKHKIGDHVKAMIKLRNAKSSEDIDVKVVLVAVGGTELELLRTRLNRRETRDVEIPIDIPQQPMRIEVRELIETPDGGV